MDNYNYNNNNEYQMTAVRKGKKAPLIIGISAALLLGGSGAAYAAVPAVNNAVNKTFMNSEKYCRKVYSKAFDDAVLKMKDCSNQSGNLYSSAFSFELSDELKNTINENFDSEICGKISFECETGCSKSNDSVFEYKGVLKADGNEAMSADLVYDSKNGVLYLTLPELSSKTLKIASSDEEQGSTKIPSIDKEAYMKLIKEYVEILEKYSANDSTVMTSDSTGTAAGVLYSYTELTTVIDGEQAKSLMKETADFMEKSDTIKEWYNAYTAPYQAFAEDMTFEKKLEDIRNTDVSDFESVTLVTLVDPNGDIRGLTISQGSDKLFSFAEAKDKNDVGLAISFEDDFSVTAKAVQNKDEYTGTLKVSDGDTEVFSADFSNFKIKKDNVSGSFSFDIPDLLGESEEKKHVQVNISADDKSQKYEMNIDSIGKISFENKLCKDKADVKIPENAESVDSFDNISEYFDKEDAVNSILGKFGLSEDALMPKNTYSSFNSDMDDSYFSDDDSMSYNFDFDSDSSGWSFSDDETETEGSWVENEDGWFEWVPAA